MSDTPDKVLPKLKRIQKLVELCRDFQAGGRQVYVDKYLPRWTLESDEGYRTRKESTAFSNLYSSVVTDLAGIITKKEPDIEGFEAFPLEDIDGKGSTLWTFCKDVVTSSIVAGCEFVAVETTDAGKVVFKRYKIEQLVTYQVEDDVVTQLVFRDDVEVPEGKYGVVERQRHIVFNIGGGEVWFDDGDGLRLKDEWTNDLSVLPVECFVTGKVVSLFEVIPRLYDVAKLNQVCFNVESQLANVLSVVGNPVPLFYGTPATGKLTVGVKAGLVFRDRSLEGFEYAEINGNGISKLQEKVQKIHDDIDSTAFNLLTTNVSKTVIDAQQNQSRSSSFLTVAAEELESKINALFEHMSEISGIPLPAEPMSFEKSFDDILFSVEHMRLMQDMVSFGTLSKETLWEKMKAANILPKHFDPVEEESRLDVQPEPINPV